MHPLVNVGVTAARAAGNLTLRYFDRADQLKVKEKSPSDFVSEVDQAAEQEIVRSIKRYYPNHAILGEEGGASGDSEWQWIIDPIDGTTNFLHRIPHYAISIGLAHEGQIEHAVIYHPCADELYIASRGAGASMNNRKLRVSRARHLPQALIGTGMPIRNPDNAARFLPMLDRVMDSTAGVRRAGSAALDLAYVASGRLDGFWEMNLKPWDIAAGLLLVQEAGGLVTDLFGGDDVLHSGNVLAGNPAIHTELRATFDALD